MTDTNATKSAGWIFYDGECAFCLGWVRRLERAITRRHFRFVPLQAPDARERLKLTDETLLVEMKLLLSNDRQFGGADAAMEIARHIWWLWPVWFVSRIPGVMNFLRAGYRCLAKNRHCASGACGVRKQMQLLNWLPLLVMPIATLPLRDRLPNWIFMWLFVTALFAGCKWLTWRRAQTRNRRASLTRSLGYLFGWPGMDANLFLTGSIDQKPKSAEWTLSAGRFLAGIVIVWLAAKTTITNHPMLIAWIGMFGLVLILHFGLFHLLALGWQRAGVPAKPLMQSPLSATSLADFWGARWNTAFNKLIHDLAFRPLARRAGVAWATMGVFAISGVVHELAISLPARGGYGLPLGYFLLQGLGVLIERSQAGRAMGLSHGNRGWLFVFVFTAAPAYWLFHPAFIHNVILPMLQSIGAN